MTTFSGMSRAYAKRLALVAVWACLPCAAKSPEEFVGPAPDSAKAAPPAARPSGGKAPSPGAAPSASASAKPVKPQAADTSKRASAGPASAAPAPAAKSVAPAAAQTTGPAAAKPAAPAAAKSSAAAKPVLDTARIHGLYLDGDFDQAIRALESALRGRKPIPHADSVFIFKHLGVMYAATPATREKGRYYMLQLISIEPTAKILDMYASDMIYLIFRNVQEEFEAKHGKSSAAEPAADTAPAPPPVVAHKDTVPPPPAARPEPKPNRTLYWAAGGAAVAAGTAGLLFILLDDPQPKKRNIILKE